jgi:hypothetical protein
LRIVIDSLDNFLQSGDALPIGPKLPMDKLETLTKTMSGPQIHEWRGETKSDYVLIRYLLGMYFCFRAEREYEIFLRPTTNSYVSKEMQSMTEVTKNFNLEMPDDYNEWD